MTNEPPMAVEGLAADVSTRNGKPGYVEMLKRGIQLKEYIEERLREINNLTRDDWPYTSASEHVPPINQMPHLKERLGKSRTDPIAGQLLNPLGAKRSNREKRIENTVITDMQGRSVWDICCPVSDVISGIANLDHHSQKGRNIPLSKSKIYTILKQLETISTRNVITLLDLGERQAQKYVKACEVAMPFLEKALTQPTAHCKNASIEDRFDAFLTCGL